MEVTILRWRLWLIVSEDAHMQPRSPWIGLSYGTFILLTRSARTASILKEVLLCNTAILGSKGGKVNE